MNIALRLYLILLLISFSGMVKGQAPSANDSYQRAGHLLSQYKYDSALNYNGVAEAVAIETGNDSLRLQILVQRCEILLGQYEYDAAYNSATKALKISFQHEWSEMESEIDFLIKEIERQKFDYLQNQLTAQKKSNQIQKVWIFLVILISVYLLGFVVVFRRLISQKNKTQKMLESKNRELIDKRDEITETQNRLIQSEKMALLGRLSAGIAHEINSPIGALKGNIELLEHVHGREVEKWLETAKFLKKEIFENLFELIEEAQKQQTVILSFKEENKLKKSISKFFSEVDIENKDDIIDVFTSLKVSENLNRFDALYSHEFNTNILDLALYITNRLSAVMTAKTALKQAETILSSFRTYSFHRGWEDFQVFNISENIDTIISLHKNRLNGITVEKIDKGDTNLNGIADELNQVWSNLISNAAQAMNDNGVLTIRINGTKDRVNLEFEDTGGGIHLKNGEDIFEPFFTTKMEGEGSGLGLDISRQIIVKHNGTIHWKNTSNGALFEISLPKNISDNNNLQSA